MRLPAYNALAMMLVMVWLLPVPGGPSITIERPAITSATAANWLASAWAINTGTRCAISG